MTTFRFIASAAVLASGFEHPAQQRQKSSNLTNFRSTSQSDAHQHSSKRSFFRRKHKFKGHSMNTHGQSAADLHSFDTGTRIMMNGGGVGNSYTGAGSAGLGTDDLLNESSMGHVALTDPTMGLQDKDPPLWADTMEKEDIVSLDAREVKRQEVMYEIIMTEKSYCLMLAVTHYLCVGGMKRNGFSRQARLLFPDFKEFLQVR